METAKHPRHWASMAVSAMVLMMSCTVAPRERSLTGLLRPCSTGPMASAPGGTLHGLVADVAGAQVGEHEHVDVSGHVVALGLGGCHVGRPCGVELDGADDGQVRSLLLDDSRGLFDDVHVRPLAGAEGGVGEHADLGLDAERLGGHGGLQRDLRELFGVRVEVDGAVGEHGHVVLEAHQEGAGDEPLPGLGLDDLQRRTHGVCGGVDRAGHQTIGVTEHDEHRAEIARVGQLLAGLLFGHALLGAQLAQLGDHGLEDVLVVHGLGSVPCPDGSDRVPRPGRGSRPCRPR
mgnify:CR=1 FL=1